MLSRIELRRVLEPGIDQDVTFVVGDQEDGEIIGADGVEVCDDAVTREWPGPVRILPEQGRTAGPPRVRRRVPQRRGRGERGFFGIVVEGRGKDDHRSRGRDFLWIPGLPPVAPLSEAGCARPPGSGIRKMERAGWGSKRGSGPVLVREPGGPVPAPFGT